MQKSSFEARIDREAIQQTLEDLDLDGWLLYDFRRSNDLACRMLGIAPTTLLTRRWAYWIPRKGEPVKLVHRIEKEPLASLPGEERDYASWQEWQQGLAQLVKGQRRIAMEYSPNGALPVVSKVDAGTLELVREQGVEVISSADLIQQLTPALSPEQVQSHLFAARFLQEIVEETWAWISEHIRENRELTEYQVQQYIMNAIEQAGLMTDGPAICAVNANSADPHYVPSRTHSSPIRKGDWLLIDLCAKQDWPEAIYADITRVAVLADQPTAKQQKIFDIVKNSRDAGIALVRERFSKQARIEGWEVDACCRKVINQAGYRDYFIHRTGHSIDTHDHGSGANLDHFETHDTRRLLPGSCFSIEPGIYLPGEFGVRLEEDLYVDEKGWIAVTPGMQEQIQLLI